VSLPSYSVVSQQGVKLSAMIMIKNGMLNELNIVGLISLN